MDTAAIKDAIALFAHIRAAMKPEQEANPSAENSKRSRRR